MDGEGPLLEALTHRLAECPPEFLLPPGPGAGQIDVVAIVCDHLRAMGHEVPFGALSQLAAAHVNPVNCMRLKALAAWLLHEGWFLGRKELVPWMWQLLTSGLDDLAVVVPAEAVVNDADRREEFVRVCLKALGLRPRGETAEQSADRLTTLDSAERVRVVRQTRDAEARARKIREQMAAEAARAAAARYTPE